MTDDGRPERQRTAATRRSPAQSGAVVPRLSVVIPMHDEADNVTPLFARLIPVLESAGAGWEVLCVDDGSLDATLAAVRELHAREPRIKLLRLSRNFGKEVAIAAGLAHARGQAVVLMDADLQHPPEVIPAMLDRWRDGSEMVYGVRRQYRRPSLARRLSAHVFYRVFSRVTKTDLPPGSGDFRLLDRKVVDAINACAERSRFNKGLFAWVGFRHAGVPFDVPERAGGRSQWSLFTLWRHAVDAITAFSNLPLRVWSYLGVAISLLAMSYGAFIVLRTLLLGRDVPGYASLIVALTFFSGVQLISLGVIGEYLGRVFTEVKRRPLYIVADALGFAEADEPAARPAPLHQHARDEAIALAPGTIAPAPTREAPVTRR